MIRVPFTLPDVGLREIEGMVGVEDGFVTIELTNKLLGLIDEDREIIKIEPGALREVRLQRRPFKDRLILAPKKRDLLDLIPGKHPTDIQLRIWRTSRRDTEQLLVAIEALRLRSGSESAGD